MYNLLIGGAAGQGIDTTVAILERLLKKSGYFVYATRDLMSRIRGGHNFSLIRFGSEPITSHSNRLDGIIALNSETVELHKEELDPKGFILCDTSLAIEESRAIALDMNGKAKALGNVRVSGSIAIGAILKLFGLKTEGAEAVFKTAVKAPFVEINLKALEEGYNSVAEKFPYLGGSYSDYMIISGNKALCLGSIAAGLTFYSAYPMSPSTSIMEYLATKANDASIVVEQAEDEIAAINMAIGASFAGAKAMTGTSGGGFSLKVEALGLAGMAEVPLVVVDVQRPGPVTGLPTRTEQSDLKFVISASQGEFPRMVIALRNHTDAFTQTIRAFNLAEKFQIPVIILSDQYLAETTTTVPLYDLSGITRVEPLGADGKEETLPEGEEYLRYRYTDSGISPRRVPGTFNGFVSADSDEHDEKGYIIESADVRIRMMDKRMKKLDLLEQELIEPEFIGEEECETLLLSWGSLDGPVKEAITLLNKEGKGKFGALVFGDIFPLPKKVLLDKASKASRIINVEQNATGQLAGLVREYTGIACNASVLKYDGRQLSGEEIALRVGKETWA